MALGDVWEHGLAADGTTACPAGPRRRPLQRGPSRGHPRPGQPADRAGRTGRRGDAWIRDRLDERTGSPAGPESADRGRRGLRLRHAHRGLRPAGGDRRRLPPTRRLAARRCGPRRRGRAERPARHLVAGLERADSVVWDAHKMLFVPGLCAFVFYRDKSHRFEAFRQDAPYLFDPAAPGLAEYDSGMKTVECTKRAAAFGLWGVWSLFGRQLFADMVDVTFALGRTFYEKLLAADDFVPLHEPQCNIVVFRHVPGGAARRPDRTRRRLPARTPPPPHRVGRVLHRAVQARRRRRAARHDHQPADHARPTSIS